MRENRVKGKVVDGQTRCIHYHSETDVIAIRFACCGHYYPCYFCHLETADHPVTRWMKEQLDEKAILCGVCGEEMTLSEYINSSGSCPACHTTFNAGCKKHWHYYFDVTGLSDRKGT